MEFEPSGLGSNPALAEHFFYLIFQRNLIGPCCATDILKYQ
jgi:hypothetical protein